MDRGQLERKLKLLILGDLGSKNIGRELPYAEIAPTLQISEDEVEIWVIDGTGNAIRKMPLNLMLFGFVYQ